MINRYVPVAPLEKNGIYFPQVEKGRENLLVRGFWIVEYRQFEFKFHHRFICEASMWRTSKQIFFLFGSHFMGCIGYILGCASACRESFRVFTFRSCNMTQPAGRYTYCRSKARYLSSIFRKISPYKQMRNPVLYFYYRPAQKKSPLFEIPTFLPPTNLGQLMHSQSALM